MSVAKLKSNPSRQAKKKFEPQMFRAAKYVAAGFTIGDIAELIGVAPSTITRWKTNPEFIEEVEAQYEVMRRKLNKELQKAGTHALQTLVEVAIDRTQSARDRVAAAEHILNRIGVDEIQETNQNLVDLLAGFNKESQALLVPKAD